MRMIARLSSAACGVMLLGQRRSRPCPACAHPVRSAGKARLRPRPVQHRQGLGTAFGRGRPACPSCASMSVEDAAIGGVVVHDQGTASRAGSDGPASRMLAGVAWHMPSRAVKWKVLPWPGSLSTQIRPPIIATSCAEMVSPRPVPPMRASSSRRPARRPEMSCCFSGGMPMPVSRTAKCSSTAIGRHAVLAVPISQTTTSPCSVNLMALPTRLIEHLPQPAGIAHADVGHVGADVAGQFEALSGGPAGPAS